MVNRTVKSVAIRVDMSFEIGTGHFTRCLALADGLKRAGTRTRFIVRHAPAYLCDVVATSGHELISLDGAVEDETSSGLAHTAWLGTSRRADARDTIRALGDDAWDWMVVDHYALDREWEAEVRRKVRFILVIDDIADRMHDCDLLLDQNFYLDAERRYSGKVPDRCRLLLGPRYALLRQEFLRARVGIAPRNGEVRRILVFFGGIDAAGLTREAIEALATIRGEELHVDVVIGSQHPESKTIMDRCAALGYACYVQTRRMAELMAGADLALGAGGSASWERCCLGLPTLALPVADNQRPVVEDAALAGLVCSPQLRRGMSLADHLRGLLDNPLLLRAMSRNGMQAVDGLGVGRVLRAMGFSAVVVRRASISDSEKMLIWRNDPSIRSASRQTAPIERSEHDSWLAAVLADPNRPLLIGECDGVEVGVVRFDVRRSTAEISIHVAPQFKGNGVGAQLLTAAESWLAEHRKEVVHIEAEVLRDNPQSHGLFRGNGYRIDSTRYIKRVG